MKKIQLKAFFLFAIITSLHIVSYSQAPTIQWQNSFGGSADEIVKNVQQTFDSGYIVGGWTYSNDGDVSGNHGKIDYWIVKLNNAGNIEWQKCLGGGEDDEGDGDLGGLTIQQTKDTGYVIAANTASIDGDVNSNHGGIDYWVVKLNKSGDLEWQKTLGGTKTDIARSIHQTSDGGYIVAGSSESNDGDVLGNHGYNDYWVVRLDKLGKIIWQKCYGGSGDDFAFSIRQISNGNFIVAGYTDSNDGEITGPLGEWDYWVVKLDDIGKIIWQKSYGGSGEDYATDVIESSKGGYTITGYTSSDDGQISTAYGEYDSWIIKITDEGIMEWQKSLGGSGDDAITSIQQTTDSNYVITQLTSSTDIDSSNDMGSIDTWIAKLNNADGTIIWQKFLGGSDVDIATSVQQTKDGGYIVGNYSASNDGDLTSNKGGTDYWIVKLKSTEVLPVTWVSVKAAVKNANDVEVTWQTADELNVKSYVVQKSSNGVSFSNIAVVQPGSKGFTYAYTDAAAFYTANKVYYRILETDNDGKTSYSKVVYVTAVDNNISVEFYPNPVQHVLHVKNLQDGINKTISVINVEGKIMSSLQTVAGSCDINTGKLAPGVYYLLINTGADKLRYTFIKQ